jgi:hypothetical protein
MAAFGMEPVNSTCPYCGESIELLVDCSVRKQTYIEDCQVCCKPMIVRVIVDEEGPIRPSFTGGRSVASSLPP